MGGQRILIAQRGNTLKKVTLQQYLKSDPPYSNTPKNYDPPSNLPIPQVMINERSLIIVHLRLTFSYVFEGFSHEGINSGV